MALSRLVSSIIKDVRVAMDENASVGELVVPDSDTLDLDGVIDSKIEDGVRAVFMEAGAEELVPVTIDAAVSHSPLFVTWDLKDGVPPRGRVEIPCGDGGWNVMRVLSFMMSDWDCAVRSFTAPGTQRYLMQRSGVAGVCGSPSRPVVASVTVGGSWFLEFYSCASMSASVSSLDYVKEPCRYVPQGQSSPVIDIPGPLYRKVVYKVAELARSVFSVG